MVTVPAARAAAQVKILELDGKGKFAWQAFVINSRAVPLWRSVIGTGMVCVKLSLLPVLAEAAYS